MNGIRVLSVHDVIQAATEGVLYVVAGIFVAKIVLYLIRELTADKLDDL